MAENTSPLVVPGESQIPDGLNLVEEPAVVPGDTVVATPDQNAAPTAAQTPPAPAPAPAADQPAAVAAGDTRPEGLIISTH